MQASALLLCWGSYHWARNLWVLIIYLFFLPVMLPSVLPRLTTDSAVRVFPGVGKLLFFQDSLPRTELCPYLFCLFFCLLYFFPTSFRRQWVAFLGAWCPLLTFISCFVECSFDEFVGEEVVSPSYSTTILGPPPSFFMFLKSDIKKDETQNKRWNSIDKLN